ncbi:MAG TPA: hypothetical protein VFD30_02010 [Terriglobia bacterium]|nr:hypothetical protein [Terriglobia bacterium]
MAFTSDELRANRDYFVCRLHPVEGGSFNFICRDARRRNANAGGHILGALCAPMEELDQFTPRLPNDKEAVTYCQGHD